MPKLSPFSYAVVRIVPHVEREEFINAGVILFCDELEFLGARIQLDQRRLAALWPSLETNRVERHLNAIPIVCAGGSAAGKMGELTTRERWQWLVAPKSTVLQTSPAHSGLCADPPKELERLLHLLVGKPSRTPPP